MSAPTSVVLDTHAFIWYLQDAPQLSPTAARSIDDATVTNQPLVISAVTLVELRYLVEKGKFSEADFIAFSGALGMADSPFEVASINEVVALRVGDIPRDVIPDPWDRMIAATALALGIPLVTCDGKLRKLKSPISIW